MTGTEFYKAVVIPVYKSELSRFEEISLDRCFEFFGENPIVLVCPYDMDITNYTQIAEKFKISLITERFNPNFFKGLGGYNKLMLDKEFYERFVCYDRILIYQPDCFVFEGDFDYWCSFDYTGAPWIFNTDARSYYFDQINLFVRRICKSILRKPNHWDTVQYKVGNGGFSIRNPKLYIDIIDAAEKNGVIQKYREPMSHYYMEDVFWGIEVNRFSDKKIKVPGFRKALRFSFESLPSVCYRLNNNSIPFGCHAWAKFDIDFWKPYIEKYGYVIE